MVTISVSQAHVIARSMLDFERFDFKIERTLDNSNRKVQRTSLQSIETRKMLDKEVMTEVQKAIPTYDGSLSENANRLLSRKEGAKGKSCNYCTFPNVLNSRLLIGCKIEQVCLKLQQILLEFHFKW